MGSVLREAHARSAERNICLEKSPWRTPDAPIVCPEESPCFFADYGPKVCRGERRKAGIQWIQPPKAVSAPEFRQTTSGAHGSAGRADCLPRGKPFGAPAGAYPCPRRGLTRRLRRGRRACSPMGRSHFSFGGERKVCKRKPAARRLQRRPAPLRVIRKYRRSGHCRARPLYLLRPVSR